MAISRIMVIGPMTSGKTAVADHLTKNYGFKKLTLAKAVKQIIIDIEKGIPTIDIIHNRVSKYIKLTNNEYENLQTIINKTTAIEHEIPKPRKRLQYLGTDGGREIVRNTIWIDIIKSQIKPNIKYVIDDVRFINEYNTFLKMYFVPIKLRISKETQDKRIRNLYGNYDPKILKHPSETELKQISINPKFIVNNDGPLDHLFHYIDLILNLKRSN